MTEPERLFSDEDKKRIAEAISQKKITPVCPLCHTQKFAIVDGFLAPRLFRNSGEIQQVFGDHAVYPNLALVCHNCGFLAHISLQYLGLMDLFAKGESNG